MFQLPPRIPVTFAASSGKEVELLSPSDHKPITKVQMATAEDIDVLLGELPKSQKKMLTLKANARAEILDFVRREILKNAEELSWLIALEGGKPLKDAKLEVARAAVTLELCKEECLRQGGEVLPMERTAASLNHLAMVTREPIGPVLAISAFNHPLNLLVHQVGCAIASGCPVVMKPAPQTPLCAAKLESYFQKAGLPRECLFLVNAEVAEIRKLVSSPRFDYVSFIGSAKVGWELRSILASGTRLGLEHGGQAPAIVCRDADLSQAISALIKGSFYHAGQVCISTQRIFVHADHFEAFVKGFTEATKSLTVGVATDAKTDVGPLIRPQEVVRIQTWIQEALEQGAKLVCGNTVSGERSQFLSPTLLTNVSPESKIMREEVFGPVVCINPYQDEASLIEYLNENEYQFESAVFTKDISKAFEIGKNLTSMTVVINNHSAYRVDWMPFGGHKRSGLGMGGVRYAMEEMTRLKQIIINV